MLRLAGIGLIALLFLVGCEQETETSEERPLKLASPFVDGAVLQRDMEVPVWGWVTSGTEVTVTFAGQTKSTKADKHGKWMVKLDPLKTNAQPQTLTVTTAIANQKSKIENVLVGEVWFASGQSNMEWVAGKSMCGALANEIARSDEEIPIREFQVDTGSALFPQSRTTAKDGWKSSKMAGGFSALALSFVWSLHEELNVPIGILRCSHGATPIETWTAYEGFAAHPKLQHIAAKIRQSDPSTPEGKQAYAQFYEDLKEWQVEGEKRIQRMRAVNAMDCSNSWVRKGESYTMRPGTVLSIPPLPGIASEWKGASRMYNMKIAPLIPYAIRGSIWCQGTSNGNDGRIYAAKLEALVSGWREKWGRPDLPFYFTQQQHYGDPDPDKVGFADLREAQRLFFMNAKNVGMVLQHDLNSARPGGIHYYNKLHPGQRLARWALAHQYERDIAYCGPLYKSHTIQGNTVRVQFEQRGPGGGLMVGSKGMAKDFKKDPPAYVEPARETPGEALKHFRLAGKDRVWHDAEAVIEGDEVVVTSKAVPQPVGVQYAYSQTPMGANLYNRAGLPATAFAYFDGKQLFQEDLPQNIAKAEAQKKAKQNPAPPDPYLQVMSPLRSRAVIQRNKPVPVWGFALAGTEITVTFGGQTKKTVVNEFDQWLVRLDPMPATTEGQDLTIACNNGPTTTVKEVVVGDVWVLSGQRNLTNEMVIPRKKGLEPPPAIPQLREFRQKTKARRFRTPRKRRMEIGGGKYVSSWQQDQDEREITAAAYYFASHVQQKGVPIGIITLGADNPPLTWVSYAGMQNAVGFEKERDELNLAYPDTAICKAAVGEYIKALKKYNRDIEKLRKSGREIPMEMAKQAPPLPQPYYNQWASRTETATHTYNFCLSPLTPFAIRGVVWIPGEKNISENVSKYAPGLKAYAASLAGTFGQDQVPFIYAQPSPKLVEGIAQPQIKNGRYVEMTEWAKSHKEIATQLGKLAAGSVRK